MSHERDLPPRAEAADVDVTRVYIDSCAVLNLAAAHPRVISNFARNFDLALATVVGRELRKLSNLTRRILRGWIASGLVRVANSAHTCGNFDDFALKLTPSAAVLTLDRHLLRLLKRRGTRTFTFRKNRIVESGTGFTW